MAKKKFLQKEGINEIIQKAKEQEKIDDQFIKQHIQIDPELEKLIFPLTEDEFEQLKENIAQEGCRDPLVLWPTADGQYTLIDGHNRFKICQLLGVDFKFQLKSFQDVEEAKDWMINNQLGRRNVTEETRSWLRGLQYKREKKKQGWQLPGAKETGADAKRTVAKLAAIHQVSSSTIQRDEKFVDAVEKLSGGDETLRKKVLNKQIRIPRTQLVKAAETLDEQALQAAREAMLSGRSWQEALAQQKDERPLPSKETLIEAKKADFIKKLNRALDEANEADFDWLKIELEQLKQLACDQTQ